MKFAAILPFAALAAGFVLPDPQVFSELAVNEPESSLPWSSLESDDAELESLSRDIQQAAISSFFEEELDAEYDGHPHHPPTANKTIYELISSSNHTTNFTKLVNEYDDIVKLLNSTAANYTLFVPINEAFAHLPADKKPGKEVIESAIKYHIGLGFYPSGRLWATSTIPTALNETLLGDNPQRLRIKAGIAGTSVNFYSRVAAANIPAKNGVIHAVNKILVPPTFIGKELSLFPSHFSTLLLAYEKTDFVKFIHGVSMVGSTVFAPTNAAFAKLGPRANAFLFNTDKGKKYLTALLKYQIVANTTLYSDAAYTTDSTTEAQRLHFELSTLLGSKTLVVDIARLGGFVRFRVNGYVPVVVSDGIAKNGVVQVVGRVLIPPHKHHEKGSKDYDGGEIDVEDLMARLVDDVEDSEEDWISEL